MSTNVFYNAETDDYDKLLHRMCKCGHELYMHGFTDHMSSLGYPHAVLWVSQCVMCGHEGEKFICEEFRQA